MGIDTHQQPVVYIRSDCHVAIAEGFNAHAQVEIRTADAAVVAQLVLVTNERLSHEQAALSEAAWQALGCPVEDEIAWLHHAAPVESMSYVRGKLYGQRLDDNSAAAIINDINAGRYSDIQLSAYVAACTGERLDVNETIAITRAMVDSGQRLRWANERVLDKHCVGGLPGNRTTPIVVAIVSANGVLMPKTSSRAITSPAGTADTMEVITPVQLGFEQMQQVVHDVGACLAWGGSVSLSPTDDIIIRIERALDLDSEGQLVASVISKKVAAGATHVLIDIPVGPTAKVRSDDKAHKLRQLLERTGAALGLDVRTVITDGSQPIGRGIGPALEARDVLQVLENDLHAPQDLRQKSLLLAAQLLEMSAVAEPGKGLELAERTLLSGQAWQQFQRICQAQGGFSRPAEAPFKHCVHARHDGVVAYFNNRFLARLAALAGAPNAAQAGIDLHVRLGDEVRAGAALFTLHAEAAGELAYALDFLDGHDDVIRIEEELTC
ncbi:thymidine phosphorylase [Bacterioplanes sanyensis]|uniref:Putative thymidine phosphorylase n=2 Tax=Bacterioplanes sanyensis TaxID=1249553 RepID=A0A222FRC6_9GAMM|nr:thymidine phosphorylase [Bacterioplanes sanyensis]